MAAMVTVTGTFKDGAGTPNTGRIVFQLAQEAPDASGVIYTGSPISVVLDANGAFSVSLEATTDLTVAGNLYAVTEKLNGQPTRTYWIEVPSPGPLALADIGNFDQPPTVVYQASLPSAALASDMAALRLATFGKLISGRYYFASNSAPSTSAALGDGLFRCHRIYIPDAATLARIGAETTVDGQAGSKIRLGVYADDGTGYPGALVLDAGQLAGDGGAGVKELTISQTLTRGVYWIGGAVQAAASTQPTIRTCVPFATQHHPMLTTAPPAAVGSVTGYAQTAAGALPATFSPTVSLTGPVPRIHFKTA